MIKNGGHGVGKDAITHVAIPDTVTTIQKWVFAGNQLTSVIIPNSVDEIMYQAFDSNPNLKTVTLKDTLFNTIKAQSGGLSGVFGSQVTLYLRLNGTRIWKESNSYIVQFNTNGGTKIVKQAVVSGSTVTQPPNPRNHTLSLITGTRAVHSQGNLILIPPRLPQIPSSTRNGYLHGKQWRQGMSTQSA